MRGAVYYNLFRETESPGAVILAYFLVSLVVFLFTTRKLWAGLIRLTLISLRDRISVARFNKSIKSLEDSQTRLKENIFKIDELNSNITINSVADEKRKATLSKISNKLAILDADLDSRLSSMRDMKRILNQ